MDYKGWRTTLNGSTHFALCRTKKSKKRIRVKRPLFFERTRFFPIPVDICSYLKRDFSAVFGTTRWKSGNALNGNLLHLNLNQMHVAWFRIHLMFFSDGISYFECYWILNNNAEHVLNIRNIV